MVRLPVSCAAVGRDGRTSLMVVRSVDLSAGGVKVVTEHELVPGNRVRVVFRVDERDERPARRDRPARSSRSATASAATRSTSIRSTAPSSSG